MDFGFEFDERTGYRFHIDYCQDFLDIHDADTMTREIIKSDFLFNLTNALEGLYEVDLNTALAIAKAVFERMSDDSLHFHTPVHILSMFMFSYKHDIPLTGWEQLALWFHNSVYVVDSSDEMNKLQSGYFMRAMIPKGLDCNSDLSRAERAILYTSRHTDPNLEAQFDQVLDLDLCYYAWPWGSLQHAHSALGAEWLKTITLRHYKANRRRFLDTIEDRNGIFRSKIFNKKNLNVVAATNIVSLSNLLF